MDDLRPSRLADQSSADAPATATENCPDCLWPNWRRGCDFTYDESKHCLAAHLRERGRVPSADLIACKDRTIALLRAKLVKAAALLKVADVAMAEAEEVLEVPLG